MQVNDSKLLWNSINWKGNVEINEHRQPSDDIFKQHVENLLNPINIPDIDDINLDNNVPYIPILDNNFSIDELNEAVTNINKNKSL